jgi:hypothetical protein
MLRRARLDFLTAKLASSLRPIRLTQRNNDIRRAPPNRAGALFLFRSAIAWVLATEPSSVMVAMLAGKVGPGNVSVPTALDGNRTKSLPLFCQWEKNGKNI